jgi:hypothetical protein
MVRGTIYQGGRLVMICQHGYKLFSMFVWYIETASPF